MKTKSRRGVRIVPFLPVVAETLASHLQSELQAGPGHDDDFVFCTRNGRPFTRQNISERGIEEAGVKAGLGEGIRAQVLRWSFCTFVAEDSEISPVEGAALTGHDEQTWWRNSFSLDVTRSRATGSSADSRLAGSAFGRRLTRG